MPHVLVQHIFYKPSVLANRLLTLAQWNRDSGCSHHLSSFCRNRTLKLSRRIAQPCHPHEPLSLGIGAMGTMQAGQVPTTTQPLTRYTLPHQGQFAIGRHHASIQRRPSLHHRSSSRLASPPYRLTDHTAASLHPSASHSITPSLHTTSPEHTQPWQAPLHNPFNHLLTKHRTPLEAFHTLQPLTRHPVYLHPPTMPSGVYHSSHATSLAGLLGFLKLGIISPTCKDIIQYDRARCAFFASGTVGLSRIVLKRAFFVNSLPSKCTTRRVLALDGAKTGRNHFDLPRQKRTFNFRYVRAEALVYVQLQRGDTALGGAIAGYIVAKRHCPAWELFRMLPPLRYRIEPLNPAIHPVP